MRMSGRTQRKMRAGEGTSGELFLCHPMVELQA